MWDAGCLLQFISPAAAPGVSIAPLPGARLRRGACAHPWPGGAWSLLISSAGSSCARRREAEAQPCAASRRRERGGCRQGRERKERRDGSRTEREESGSGRSGGSCSAALRSLFTGRGGASRGRFPVPWVEAAV